MKIYRPLWNQGALLSPQQFQQQSVWESFRSAGRAARASAFPWGVEKVEFDERLLSGGLIQVSRLRLWLEQGLLLDTEISDLPPSPRDLDAVDLAGRDTLTVLIALPLMQPGISNVQQSEEIPDRPLRYREQWIRIQDFFGSEDESVAVARFNLSIRFAHENNELWDTCPVTRMVRNQHGGWHLEADFIPPIALFSASSAWCDCLVLLNRQLRSRRQRLMSMRRESNERLADFAVADVSLFWLLNALNSHARVLSEYEHFPAPHPEQVWRELAQLTGSLLTFSLERDLDEIPGYNHLEPTKTFLPLFELITGLLEASLPSRVIALEMSRPDEQTWKASLHDMRLREEADLYLSVRSDIPVWQLTRKFPALCQAGSPDEVREIYSAALKGSPLIPVSRVPAPLPVRLENQYFALDMESRVAHDMQQQGVCIFYVPSLLGNLELELFAVLRT